MLKKISIAISSVFLLLLFSCSNLFGSYDTSTKLTIGLPSGEYSRQAEGSKSLYYKVTCNPDFSGPSKMEKYGKSGEKIEFNNLTAGNYSIKVEGFQNEKMEMLLYKGEGNATVVAGENTNITIALKYVGPKSETPLGIGDSYIDLTFNEDTGFKVEVHAVENITPKTIYWIYNNFVMDEYTGRYTLTEDAYGEYENPLAVSAVVEFSDGTYSSASATDAVYKDSDVYSFEKQHSYKEMKEETDTGLLNYTLKINKSTETFETDIQVFLMDELLAGDAEPVLMMEKTSGTSHTYTEDLEPGWYFVVSHINCGLIGDFDGNSFSLSQVVKIEQGYECNFGIGVNLLEAGGSGAGSGSDDDSGSGAGDGGSRTFSEVYGDIEVISPVADSFDETCKTTNMASLASTLAGETDKASEKVICIDGSWVAPHKYNNYIWKC